MPEQTYGEDDKGETAKASKKIDLKKYASMPDINVRDIFWQVMERYAEKKALTAEEFAALEHHKISLLRIALTEIGSGKGYHGLTGQAVATHMLMLCMDAGWNDILGKEMAR